MYLPDFFRYIDGYTSKIIAVLGEISGKIWLIYRFNYILFQGVMGLEMESMPVESCDKSGGYGEGNLAHSLPIRRHNGFKVNSK